MADLLEENGVFTVQGICIVPYTVSAEAIETDMQEEECMDGTYEFERVGTWVHEGQTFIVAEKDNQVTVYKAEGFEQVDSFEGDTFSLKKEGELMLIIDDQIHISDNLTYFSQNHTTTDNSTTDNSTTGN